VRPGSRTKLCVLLVLPQNRHPERSAAQIHRPTQRLWRGVEGPRQCLSSPYCSALFNHRARKGRAGYGFSPGAENQQILLWGFVVEKLRAARENKHRRGPSTPRHKRCVGR
jgi:hypothetical protein